MSFSFTIATPTVGRCMCSRNETVNKRLTNDDGFC